jgi:hypothetical protein
MEILSVSVDPGCEALGDGLREGDAGQPAHVAGRKKIRIWVDNSPMEKWVLVPAGLRSTRPSHNPE